MATQSVTCTVPTVVIARTAYPPPANPWRPEKPVLYPGGNTAAGGPTAGQLFPVGNR